MYKRHIMKIHSQGKKMHDTILRKKFGIGLVQYQKLLEQQNHKCFICETEDWRNLAVDHNHQTGQVRGLLCTKCNTGIGQFQDNIELLLKAVEYLTRECIVPEDVEVENIPHKDRARWRRVVVTPIGMFASLDEAGKAYNVHPTTIGYWCGDFKHHLHLKKDGFSSKKVFCTVDDIHKGNI